MKGEDRVVGAEAMTVGDVSSVMVASSSPSDTMYCLNNKYTLALNKFFEH